MTRALPVAARQRLAVRPPAERAVIIGTLETARQARQQIAVAPDAPEPMGCILVDRAKPRAGGGVPVFGRLEDLARVIAARGITVAVVSLPMARAETINRVRAILRE